MHAGQKSGRPAAAISYAFYIASTRNYRCGIAKYDLMAHEEFGTFLQGQNRE
jgi:hypothetical protein